MAAGQFWIRLNGSDDVDAICAMLRGLLYSNRNSDGHTKKNQQFRNGVTITFGTPPMGNKFLADFEAFFSKRVRARFEIMEVE